GARVLIFIRARRRPWSAGSAPLPVAAATCSSPAAPLAVGSVPLPVAAALSSSPAAPPAVGSAPLPVAGAHSYHASAPRPLTNCASGRGEKLGVPIAGAESLTVLCHAATSSSSAASPAGSIRSSARSRHCRCFSTWTTRSPTPSYRRWGTARRLWTGADLLPVLVLAWLVFALLVPWGKESALSTLDLVTATARLLIQVLISKKVQANRQQVELAPGADLSSQSL
ncbi:unnamed protein product, partial [Urochloa humidicola]